MLSVLILLSSFAVVSVSAQTELRCNSVQDTEVCIEEMSLSKTTVNPGEKLTIDVTLRNVGNETADATILLGIKQPEGGFDYYRAEEVRNLEADQQQTISIPVRMEKGEPVGVHEVNVMVFDDSQEHLYDASGYYQKIIVEKGEPLDPVKAYKELGEIAQATLALISLAILLLTGRWVSNVLR